MALETQLYSLLGLQGIVFDEYVVTCDLRGALLAALEGTRCILPGIEVVPLKRGPWSS